MSRGAPRADAWRRVFLLAGVALLATACAGPVAPDLVITNARVFTNDPARPWAEAVAMKGERVIAVGPAADALAAKGPATRVVDAGGRVLVPGFNDAHVHVDVSPETLTLTLEQDPSLDALAAALAAADRAAAPGVILRGSIGPAAWEAPALTRAWLDARVPARPVWLQMWTGHGDVLNSAALALVGLDDTVRDPAGGRHGRDASGRLDGRLEEYAAYIASRRLAELTPSARVVSQYRAFADAAVRVGITSVQLMSTGLPARLSVPRLLEAATPLRWRIFRLPTTAAGAETEDGRPHLPPQPGPRLDVRGTKWILDGTPVERLAAVSAPYTDRPAERGRMNLDAAALDVVVREGYGTENQLAVHAVGDAAIEAYLSALERVGAAAVWQRKRPRLEHGDMLTPAQMARARTLGVVLVQNPAHFLDRDTFAARLGSRLGTFQPLASVLAAGGALALGSDGPLSPFLNIAFATSRPGHPAEALTREQAVAAYTRGAAFAESTEPEKGWLAPGTLADVAVLSDDLFTVPLERLPGLTSVLTVVGGTIVYDAGVLPH
ncbi:MAG: amidohydrolase [Acidobacteria bacterium]|nr:amidohydrolase [Acidobacteriota bacterium]